MSNTKEMITPTNGDRQGVKPKEVIGGNRLLTQTVNSVNQAFRKWMPEMPNLQPSLSVSLIDFSNSRKKIEEMETQERKSNPQYMHDELIDAGASPKYIDFLFSRVDISRDIPVYWNRGHGARTNIYIPKDIKTKLSEDLQTRTQTAMALGIQLIEQMIMRSPVPSTVDNELWQEITSNNVDIFFERTVEEQKTGNPDFANLNLERFALAKKKIHTLLRDRTTKFIAHGAEVNIVFPEQDIETSDFSLGAFLNQGIIEYLARPIQAEFFKLMTGDTSSKIKQIVSQTETNSMQIAKALGIDISSLPNAFYGSDIPNRYLANRNAHIEAVKDRIKGYKQRQLLGMVFSYLFNSQEEIINPNLYPN